MAQTQGIGQARGYKSVSGHKNADPSNLRTYQFADVFEA